MKLKLSLAALLACGSLVMALAAPKVETCDDKYKTCGEACTNQQYNCKASGRTPESCATSYKSCMKS